MRIIKSAEYAAKVKKEYMVIGHCMKYAVVMDEEETLFCLPDEDAVLDVGCACEPSELVPLETLSLDVKSAIIRWYESEVKSA